MSKRDKQKMMEKAQKKVIFYSRRLATATSEGAIEMYDGLCRMWEQQVHKIAMM